MQRELGDLTPISRGVRVKYNGGERSVIDGPFTDAREMVLRKLHQPTEVADLQLDIASAAKIHHD